MWTKYKKGRRKEYKICKELKEAGFDVVQRTAGSHSPIDIIAIDCTKRKILLIQSKPDTWTQHQINKLLNECEFFNGVYDARFEVR